MPLSPEFTDPRLVAVCEALNGYAPGTQPDFYLRTAHECGARSVLEVGCGTGLVTRRFLADGFDVTGIDPSGPMLDVARARPGAEAVRWIEGDLDALDVTGHARALPARRRRARRRRAATALPVVDELRRTLDEAGFAVTQAYGDWYRRPLDAASPEIILVAAGR